jgi:hypothetical protein
MPSPERNKWPVGKEQPATMATVDENDNLFPPETGAGSNQPRKCFRDNGFEWWALARSGVLRQG